MAAVNGDEIIYISFELVNLESFVIYLFQMIFTWEIDFCHQLCDSGSNSRSKVKFKVISSKNHTKGPVPGPYGPSLMILVSTSLYSFVLTHAPLFLCCWPPSLCPLHDPASSRHAPPAATHGQDGALVRCICVPSPVGQLE